MSKVEPILLSSYILDTQPCVLVGCKEAFHLGDFMRWEGEPGASLLTRGDVGNASAVALERISPGQAVELIRDGKGWVGARLAR